MTCIERPVSNCCSGYIVPEWQTCSKCGEHCDWVEVEYEPEWTEAEQANMWGE